MQNNNAQIPPVVKPISSGPEPKTLPDLPVSEAPAVTTPVLANATAPIAQAAQAGSLPPLDGSINAPKIETKIPEPPTSMPGSPSTSVNTTPIPATNATLTSNNEPPKKSSGGMAGRFILLFIFMFIVISLALLGGFGYTLLKKQYVPYVTPVFEGMLNSPSEQLAQRLDIYYDLVQVINAPQAQKEKELSNLSLYQKNVLNDLQKVKSIGFTSQIQLNYDLPITLGELAKANLGFDFTTNNDVLGVNTAAGSLDQEGIEKIMAAKIGTIIGKTEGKIERTSQNDINFNTDSSQELTFSSAGVNIGTKFRTISILDSTSVDNDANYYYLDYFPANPFIFTDSIEKKWIKVPSGLTNTLTNQQTQPAPRIKPSSTPTVTPTNTTSDSADVFNNFLRSPSVQKAITSAPNETINGKSSKCFNITINKGDWQAIFNDLNKADPVTFKDPKIVSDTELPDLLVTLCFDDSLLIFNKISATIKLEDPKVGKLNLTASFNLNGINESYQILAPTDNVINIMNVDITKIVPSLMNGMGLGPSSTTNPVIGPSTAPTKDPLSPRNAQRISDVMVILNAISQYTSEMGNSLTTLTSIPEGNTPIPACLTTGTEAQKIAAMAKIGTAPGNVNLEKRLLDTYLMGMPFDPTGGYSSLNTGYAICQTARGLVQISAPNAESNEIIILQR